ncbi:MAG: efflux RND transporter periplasmic adaptor subunit [Bacteroidetes bacterium]|nr:efflux RND transporter periplasmic adaptor subunit [Bacteroidota bacterium]
MKQSAAIATIVLFSACSSNKQNTEAIKEAPVAVTVATPSADGQQAINLSGQIEAAQSVNLSTRVMGFITMLKVKTGDHVTKGQLLVTISNQDILAKRAQTDAMISEAEAALSNAQKDYDRFTTLYKQQSATAKELENVTLQYNAAKARVQAAQQMRNEVNASLGYTILTAPFSGIVTQKSAEAGNIANPGMPILTIEQSGSYQVTASVPENVIAQIHEGDAAEIAISAVNKSFKGAVTQINQSSQFTGGQYIVKISIPDTEKKAVYAGMYATVNIPLKTTPVAKPNDNSILVPSTSLVQKDQLTGIYTIGANNVALLRWIRIGKTYGDKVEVLSGLDKTDSFIVSAGGKLYNGVTVTIK